MPYIESFRKELYEFFDFDHSSMLDESKANTIKFLVIIKSGRQRESTHKWSATNVTCTLTK